MTFDEPLFPIVGVGASAGGIPAIEELLKAMPSDAGLSLVIVTHLSPTHESVLNEIFERSTPMPVFIISDGMRVEPNCVYVMPENAILTIEDGVLRLRRPDSARRERNPIDIFLVSLAKNHGEYAAAIVLSGGGGDGTLGIKAIKECGGLTLAQTADGTRPAHDDMPQSAIATGMVDYAMPVQDMPERLVEFQKSFNVVEANIAVDAFGEDRNRRPVYDALRKQTGHDFSGYKAKTFMRRIHRRMRILQIADIDAYIERLEADHDEVMQLFRDLLINVTDFFRDADAFDALESTIIPSLFEGRSADDTVRVWVPGCATGEEVFSIGILLREYMDTLKAVPRVQIFATDIDDTALLVARAARYPGALLEGITPERRRRFFTEDGESYVVAKEVRDLCIFSPHSVIRDPPFSRIDLVSCRNLLIYFGTEIQKQVIPIFHYALKPGGYLFLGTSENIGEFNDLFASIDKKQRIFQARDLGPAKRLPIAIYGARSTPFVLSQVPSLNAVPLRHMVEARVIDRFAAAHVVVNGDGDVVYCSQHTGNYLEVAHGPPSRQLLAMARRGLRLDLRSALHDVMHTRKTVVRDNVIIDDDGNDILLVKLTAEPLPDRDGGEPLFLIVFEDIKPAIGRGTLQPQDRSAAESVVTALERDLRDTRERLQSMIEEYETAIEELKSSNEELVSVNEELQSTNEEMEASKEELQSLNEELQTVNMELIGKLDDLDRANSDLKNLFESTQIATVFLDRDLVIRSFTPAVSRIFRLIPTDRGRPLTDLAIHAAYPALQSHVQQVFATGATLEHRIGDPAGQGQYLVRLMPYKAKDERTDGVVVTFVDISSLADSEAQQDLLIEDLNHCVKNMLAVATSITRHTTADGTTIDAFRDILVERLQASAAANQLAVRKDWTAMPLDEVLRRMLTPLGTDRFTLDGPSVTLRPTVGRAFGRIVRELTTNAAKHGALSNERGRIAVTWALTDNRVTLDWIEQGRLATDAKTKTLSLKPIEREVESGLGGDVTSELRPEGLALTLSFVP